MTRERIYGHTLIIAVNVIFGINTPVSKWLLSERLSPDQHTILRMASACALFWAASLFAGRERVPGRDIWKLLLCGLCGTAINQYLFIRGLSSTSPVDASVITTSTPVFVMVFAALILGEPITWLKAAGVFTGAAGAVWLVVSAGGGAQAGQGGAAGNMMALASAFMYSIYFVISKPLAEKYSAVTMMKWMFLFSFLALLPLTWRGLAAPMKGPLDLEAAAAMAYVFIMATFAAYLLIPMAIRRIRPTTASMYNYLQPVVSTAIAVAAMRDSVSPQKIAAALMIFAGVYMVTKSKARRDMLPASNPESK